MSLVIILDGLVHQESTENPIRGPLSYATAAEKIIRDSKDPVSDARAWTHGHTSARLRMLCADAGAGTHAGRALTHLVTRAVEG